MQRNSEKNQTEKDDLGYINEKAKLKARNEGKGYEC